MDLSAFSEDDFDVKTWINGTLKQTDGQQSKEQLASSLVMKLQLLITKLNASLEEQSESVCQSLPRVHRETESLAQEALLLQTKMATAHQAIEKVNKETGSSMQALVNMDLLKERIQSTSKALREADNWSTLSTEIEEALDGGELDTIAEKLSGIQSSLKILSHVPDYEERVVHVEGLKNRLEALASPQLVAAFNARDADKASFFVRIFREMDRSEQLLKYFRKCLKARLLKVWSRLVADNEVAGQRSVLEWSKDFFQELEVVLKEQLTWFRSVFKESNAEQNLIQVLLEVYAGLDPKMEFCIEAGLKQQSDPLDYLIQLKQLVNKHAEVLEALLCSDTSDLGNGLQRDLARALYRPFRPHMTSYGQMESACLLSQLVTNAHTSKDIIDELRNIGQSVGKLVASFTQASKRCCQLTEGCAYPGLKASLEDCLSSYLERFGQLMRRLDKRKSQSHSSWTILQQSLSLNQASGDLLLQLEKLDLRLSMDFLDRTKGFLGPEASARDHNRGAFRQHHVFLLDAVGVAKLEEFYVGVKQGTNYPVLSNCLRLVSRLCSDLQNSAFSVLFHPVQEELSRVPEMDVWTSKSAGSDSREQDMPDFSFSPQEYITQVGQYLMTLPQHLEPYMTEDNAALARAFQERVFPYCSGIAASTSTSSNSAADGAGVEQNPADFILACVARASCDTYQAAILKVPSLSANSTKQLAMDVGYLGDILEDLGHPLSDGLSAILTLLKLPAKDYWVSSTGCPQKLVSAVRQMRNLNVAK